jgi:hypothetical protein
MMQKKIGKGKWSLMLFIAALVITVFSYMFPAAFTFGGYQGVIYHGFPAGWMGETTRGVASITNAYESLQYSNYLIGFIIDVAFWFCAAFILFSVTQLKGRR